MNTVVNGCETHVEKESLMLFLGEAYRDIYEAFHMQGNQPYSNNGRACEAVEYMVGFTERLSRDTSSDKSFYENFMSMTNNEFYRAVEALDKLIQSALKAQRSLSVMKVIRQSVHLEDI